MEENRKRKRVKYDYSVMSFESVRDKTGKTTPKKALRIVVNDISYSGIGISVNHKLAQGDLLKMNLSDGYEIMEYDLIVQWCKSNAGVHKVGCAFADLTREKLYLIDRIIKMK
jgi:hypothetical protein